MSLEDLFDTFLEEELNKADVIEKFRGKYLGIIGKEVVYASDSEDKLKEYVDKKYQNRDKYCHIRYIPDGAIIF